MIAEARHDPVVCPMVQDHSRPHSYASPDFDIHRDNPFRDARDLPFRGETPTLAVQRLVAVWRSFETREGSTYSKFLRASRDAPPPPLIGRCLFLSPRARYSLRIAPRLIPQISQNQSGNFFSLSLSSVPKNRGCIVNSFSRADNSFAFLRTLYDVTKVGEYFSLATRSRKKSPVDRNI